MAGNLQPLDDKFAIVGSDGRPTLYFIKWAQQRQIDIGAGITEDDLIAYLTAHKLIPGVGIQFAPDGDINHHVTINADAQAILDEITATRGAVIYRGLLGWAALLPGAAGLFLQTSGAGADPVWAAAGGGGGASYEVAPSIPLAANFTLLNPGAGVSMTNKTFGLWLNRDGTATGAMSIAAQNAALPGANFTATARLKPTNPRTGGGYCEGIILRNSSNGRLLFFGNYNVGQQYLAQNWTSYTAFSSNVIAPASYYELAALPWKRVVVNAGVIDFQVSPDGDVWTSLGTTVTVASFLTAAGGTLDQIGFGGFSTFSGTLCGYWNVV